MGCSAGLGAGKREDPNPVLPMPGKANVDFVVKAPVVVAGVGWVVGIENVGTVVVVVLEVVVIDGWGAADLKKLGTVVLVVVVEGSGFVVGTGLAKKFVAAGCAGTGTVGVGVGVAKWIFEGSLVPIVVTSVPGFGCVEATEGGVGKLGIVVLVMEVVVAGTGTGEGFFPTSAAFFVS